MGKKSRKQAGKAPRVFLGMYSREIYPRGSKKTNEAMFVLW
jgi:hypothetical protein